MAIGDTRRLRRGRSERHRGRCGRAAIDVDVVPLDQFHLAGGSAACLVATVHSDSRHRSTTASFEEVAHGRLRPVFRYVIFPLWETRVRRRPVLERWTSAQAHAMGSRSTSCTRSRRTGYAGSIGHAYEHVPFYRDRSTRCGSDPDGHPRRPTISSKLPVLRRADLRADGRTARVHRAPCPTIRKQTSGTTGEPLLFGFEPDSEHWRHAVKLRGYEWAGYRPGDNACTSGARRCRRRHRGDAAQGRARSPRSIASIYIPCDVMSEERLARVVAADPRRRRPQVLVCYAQAGAELARYINAQRPAHVASTSR